MRGAVAAGMVSALEQLGMQDSFDAIYGTSSGAIAGAMFITRQSTMGVRAYCEDLVDGPFIRYRRVLRGGPLVSLDYLFNWVIPVNRRFDLRRCVESDVPFTIVATRVNDGRCSAAYLTAFRDERDFSDSLRASCTVPLACGPPVTVRGSLYVDGALTEAIPIQAALSDSVAGQRPTHVLALLTRPRGELRHPPNLIDRYLLFPVMDWQTKGLGAAHLPQAEAYVEELRLLAEMSNALVVSREPTAQHVGRLEQDAQVIERGAVEGATAVHAALTGHAPQEAISFA